MAEDTARAIGAGELKTVKVAGKECKIRPLTLKELAELERECLKQVRRSFLQTFSENLDLFPKNIRIQMLQDKVEEAALWDVADLKPKKVYNPETLSLSKSIKKWIVEHFGLQEEKISTKRMKALIANSLDEQMLSPAEYTAMTNMNAAQIGIGYANWWITGSSEGRIALLLSCFRGSGVTEGELLEEMRTRPKFLIDISTQIEALSAPAVGNG